VPRVRKHLGEALGADASAIEAWGRHWTMEGIATYERLLTRRPPTPFALGETPGIADICIAGQIVLAEFNKIDLAAFPAVAALGKRCFDMPEFAQAHPSKQPGYSNAH